MGEAELPIWAEGDTLPLHSRPLGVLAASLQAPAQTFGATPKGERKIVGVRGGHFVGPRIRALILPGGGDWALTRGDGVLELDVRLTLLSDDGALIYLAYTGYRHAPPDVAARLARGEKVPPGEMYFRIAPRFETADPRYAWLNGMLSIGVGERLPEGPRYHIHEIL